MKSKIYEFMEFFPFLKEIIKRDFKKKYYKSILGVAWSMLSPLLMMAVVTIVFSTVFKRDIPFYPAYWYSGNLFMTVVFDGSSMAMGSMIHNAGLIKKMKIPKYFFVVSTVTQSFITAVFSLVPYFLLCLVLGVPMTINLLAVPLVIILCYLFTFGLGLVMCAYGTFLRDLDHLYKVLRRVFLYITPIFYPIEIVPDQFRFLFEFNPIYIFIQLFRDVTLNGVMPSERLLFIATSYSLLTLALGIVVFREKQDRFFLYI